MLKNEIKYAKWLSKYFDSDVYMVPQVKTNGVRTPDYWVERTKQYWDLKIIDGNTKFIVDNILRKSKGQTRCIIMRVGKTKFSSHTVEENIISVYFNYRRTYIDEVILIGRNERFIIHLKRK